MDTIDTILRKRNWPTRTNRDDTALLDIEKEVGFELPMDYKDFLTKYGGHEALIGEEYVALWDKNELRELNEAYSILQNLPRTLGIGDNGGGELIGMEKLDDGGHRIILTPFIDLNKQYHIEIGKSFTDFLARLDNGEEWFKATAKD